MDNQTHYGQYGQYDQHDNSRRVDSNILAALGSVNKPEAALRQLDGFIKITNGRLPTADEWKIILKIIGHAAGEMYDFVDSKYVGEDKDYTSKSANPGTIPAPSPVPGPIPLPPNTDPVYVPDPRKIFPDPGYPGIPGTPGYPGIPGLPGYPPNYPFGDSIIVD